MTTPPVCPFFTATAAGEVVYAHCAREGISYTGTRTGFREAVTAARLHLTLCIDEGSEDTGTCALSAVPDQGTVQT